MGTIRVSSDRFDMESIHNLSGAVFAFALTLLVLDFVVPDIPKGSSESALLGALVSLWPHVLAYVISFGLIASYWVQHRRMFAFITRADRTFLWMNLFFLMFIAFIPFATKLMGAYPRYHVTLLIYAVVSLVTLLLQYAEWWYATAHRRLVDPDFDARSISPLIGRLWISIIIVLACIGISFFDPLVSLITFAAMPLLSMWPVRLDDAVPASETHPA